MKAVEEPRIPGLVFAMALLALFGILAPAETLRADPTHVFERLWPQPGQPWYFSLPGSLVIDGDDFVYIADTGNGRVVKMTRNGAFVSQWATRIGDPKALAFDQQGNLLAMIEYDGRIERYTPGGQYLGELFADVDSSLFEGPSGLATTADGDIYITAGRAAVDAPLPKAALGHSVFVFSSSGRFLRSWGEAGTGPGQFGRGDEGLGGPRGIQVDAAGQVYVADHHNGRVQVFSRQGAFLRSWGPNVGQGQQMLAPDGLFVDAAGNLLVGDSHWEHGNRIFRFSAEGRLLAVLDGFYQLLEDDPYFQPLAIAADSGGMLFAVDYFGNRVFQFEQDGTVRAVWQSRGDQPGAFDLPTGIDLDDQGNLYVADQDNHRIQKFDGSGRLLRIWGDWGLADGQFYAPHDVAAGDGLVYVADTVNDRIQKFTADGTWMASWSAPYDEGVAGPFALAIDRQGNVFSLGVVDAAGPGPQLVIVKHGADGRLLARWQWPVSESPHDGNRGLEFGPDGNLYLASSDEHKIYRFSPDGRLLNQWCIHADCGWAAPADLAIAADGTLYTLDQSSGRVLSYSPQGQLLGSFGEIGSGPGNIHVLGAGGLAVDAGGRVFVSDTHNNRVQVFKPATRLQNARAVIVAGGGPYDGNNLWDATLLNANFAYRALSYQGYGKEQILYLAPDTAMDLDGNGAADDVDLQPTLANLRHALSEWATGAENLLVYLVDHGGEGSFRLNRDEVVSAAQVAEWLRLGAGSAAVTLVVDACHSGSFLPVLAGANRVVVASAATDASAYFLSQGVQSFSGSFWMSILNGADLAQAYRAADRSMRQYQTAQVDASGNGVGNEDVDLAGLAGRLLGSGTDSGSLAPQIGSVRAPEWIQGRSDGLLEALQVFAPGQEDRLNGGISRVWAVVAPPDYAPAENAALPVLDLPSIELSPAGDGYWSATWSGFVQPGSYQLAFYAQDGQFNTAEPRHVQVNVGQVLQRRAILFADGLRDGRWPTVRDASEQAWHALRQQAFGDDSIRFFSPEGTVGTFATPSLDNLRQSITQWAAEGGSDLTLHLMMPGGPEGLLLDNGELLRAADLAAWLRQAQARLSGELLVIVDSDYSGEMTRQLAALMGAQTPILLAATDAYSRAPWSDGGVSFSSYFWQNIASGADLDTAYRVSRGALSLANSQWGDGVQVESNGNGVPNEREDRARLRSRHIGSGIVLAADTPTLTRGMGDQSLRGESQVDLWVMAPVTTDAASELEVWAVVDSPDADQSLARIGLAYRQQTGRWQATLGDIDTRGRYRVSIYARNAAGMTSAPYPVVIDQQIGAPAAIAHYDTVRRVLAIAAVEVAEQSYRVVMQDLGGYRFRLLDATPTAADAAVESARYLASSGALQIPRVDVAGQTYQVRLQNQGDWVFGLQQATRLD